LPSPETALLRGNRNNKATALGRLCWVEREVALASGELLSSTLVLKGGPPPDEGKARAAVERMKTLINALPAELGSDAGLPQEAKAFRGRLDAVVGEARPIAAALPAGASLTARQEASNALTRVFDFEHFPGAKEFAAAAKADPSSCPDI
jgi:hypothetical protein